MTFTADENGLFAKKLFKKITIPYEDIESMQAVTMQKTEIKTKSGEEYTDEDDFFGLTHRFPIVSDMIRKYNISYKYEGPLEANILGITGEAAIKETVGKLIDNIRDEIRELVKEKLGEEYDVEFLSGTLHEETMLYIRLLKDGKVIDVNDGSFDEPEIGMTEVFDFTMLSYLVTWDSEKAEGMYAFLDERDEIRESIEIHCEEYYKQLNRVKIR